MLDRISKSLRKYSNGWLVSMFFAGVVFFNVLIFPAAQARIMAISGGVGTIDPLLFYTPEKAYSMVASYGEAGRAYYRNLELTGDIIYPVVYTLFFGMLITWLFERGFAPGSVMQKLNVLPLGTWFFDLLENLSIAAMLSIYPSTPHVVARAAAIFTLSKWLFASATVVLVLIGFEEALRKRFRDQGSLDPDEA